MENRIEAMSRFIEKILQTKITLFRQETRGHLPPHYVLIVADYKRPAYGTDPEACVRVMLHDIENGYSPRTKGL